MTKKKAPTRQSGASQRDAKPNAARSKSSGRVGAKEQRRREQQSLRRRRLLMIGVPALLLAAVVVTTVIIRFRPIAGVADYGAQLRGHDTTVIIPNEELPPIGGIHSPTWQNCGIYNAPVDTELAVHSMEHGGVWLTYQPQVVAADELEQLKNLARDNSAVLLSPFPSQEPAIVVTAWGKQLVPDSAADERLERFVLRYQGQGPEGGASCAGGIGQPAEG